MAAFIPFAVSAQDAQSVQGGDAAASSALAMSSEGVLDIDLAKAIDIALAENPKIKVADKDIELKRIADKEAWMKLLPEVDATGSWQHTLLAAEMKLGGNTFKMGQDGANTMSGSVALAIPVFAPAIYQTMKLTKEDIKLAQETARGSRLDLINQVTKAYYRLLLAQDSYKVMQKSYDISKQNYDIVNAKYTVGKVSEYDKITAEVQMRSMSSSLVSTQTALTLAELELKVLMGITANVKININDNLEKYENNLVLASLDSDESLLQNNSSLRQLDLNQTLNERNLKILRTNFMPTVSFQLSGQYQTLYNMNLEFWHYRWSPSSQFTFAVNVPIFHASNWTKLKSAKLRMAQLDDNRVDLQRQLGMSVERHRKNMASSIAQVNSNRVAVNQADKAVQIASKRYEVGKGTILELNQSEVALTQSLLTYNQSIYDYLISKAELDYTLGRETYLK